VVVLRFAELEARLCASRGEGPAPPVVVLFPWPAVVYVGGALEDLKPS
jgi:hypothetical protein